MIKFVVFGLLAVGAMAQFPGMLGAFGGIPDGALDMIKNMKPDEIKEAIENMPPEMMDMVKSMGISADQIKDAVKNIPADFDISKLTEKLDSSNLDQARDLMQSNLLKEVDSMKEQMREQSMTDFKNEMTNMGFDLSEGASGLRGQVLPKITEMMGEGLKYQGIDTDDHEALRRRAHIEIRMLVGAKEEDSDDDIKSMLRERIMEEMKQDGVEFNQEKSRDEFKREMMGQLRGMGMEVGDNFDGQSLKDMLRELKSKHMGNPRDMMKHFAPMMDLNINIDI